MPPRRLPPPPLLPGEKVGPAGSHAAGQIRYGHDLKIFDVINSDLAVGKALLEREAALAVEPGASEEALLAAAEKWQSYRPNRTVRNLALFREIYTRPPPGVSFSTHVTRIALRRHLQQAPAAITADEIEAIVSELTSEESLEESYYRIFIPPPGIYSPETMDEYLVVLRFAIVRSRPSLPEEGIDALIDKLAPYLYDDCAGGGVSGQVEVTEGERYGYSIIEFGRMIKKMDMAVSGLEGGNA